MLRIAMETVEILAFIIHKNANGKIMSPLESTIERTEWS
jgi:hypothetical protein